MSGFMMAFGMVIGALVMYLFDPDGGRRRRALLRDQISSKANKAGDDLGSKARHVENKAKGVVAEARGALEDQKDRLETTRNQMKR